MKVGWRKTMIGEVAYFTHKHVASASPSGMGETSRL